MLRSLEWLEPAPDDFKDRLRVLRRDLGTKVRGDVAARMIQLAGHALDENQLFKLARLAAARDAALSNCRWHR